MDLSTMNQVSSLVAVPTRAPSPNPPSNAPAPTPKMAEDGSGNQNTDTPPGEPVDQVQVSQPAESCAGTVGGSHADRTAGGSFLPPVRSRGAPRFQGLKP